MDVTGDRSKARCCKEQYCIVTWNIRSMNQGKLEEIKQERARVNTDILGISELKWIGMDEFNSNLLHRILIFCVILLGHFPQNNVNSIYSKGANGLTGPL